MTSFKAVSWDITPAFGPDDVEGHLRAALALLPTAAAEDAGGTDDIEELLELTFYGFALAQLQRLGKQLVTWDGEAAVKPEFWQRLYVAALQMDYYEFVPYLSGKAQGLPESGTCDFLAALVVFARAGDRRWMKDSPELAADLTAFDTALMSIDPRYGQALADGGQPGLAEALSKAPPEEIDADAYHEAAKLIGSVFDDLFDAVTAEDFPESLAEQRWTTVCSNVFTIVTGPGLFPTQMALVWWRADQQ